MRRSELRHAAINETKIGGDPIKGLVYAILYHAELQPSNDEVADAVKYVGVELAGMSQAISDLRGGLERPQEAF